jgi:dTDP-4-dehydrorhamnose reductase
MRFLVTGASGQVGAYLLHALGRAGLPAVAWSGSRAGELFGFRLRPVDLGHTESLAAAFREAGPACVIHAAAHATIAQCARAPEAAWQVNVEATRRLADLAAAAGARFVLLSTDLVFDGERPSYREEDEPSPLSTYGRTKVAAERAVLAHPRGAVLRLSLLYGPALGGRPSFFDEQVAALRQGRPCPLFEDEWRTPLDLVTAAQGILDVARSDFRGVLHMGGPERMSRLEMGHRLATFLGADPSVFVPAVRAQAASPEPRPRDVSLDSSRWRGLSPGPDVPDWDAALRRMMKDLPT